MSIFQPNTHVIVFLQEDEAFVHYAPLMADEEALRALWDSLPKIWCKGKCAYSCTDIHLSPLEHELVREAGVDIPDGQPGRCPALSSRDRCKVYRDRPTICRVWGLTRNLRCRYGCIPAGGLREDKDMLIFYNQARILGGDETAEDPEKLEAVLSRPEVQELTADMLRLGVREAARRYRLRAMGREAS